MAVKSMAYDHPAYTVPHVHAFTPAAGASSVSRFCAFTALRLKALHVTVAVAGTSAGAGNGITVHTVKGTATTSVGSVALGTSAVGTTTSVDLSSVSLDKNNVMMFTSGTDATAVNAQALEYVIVPGAEITR